MHSVGRGLQMVGLFVLPVAIFAQLSEAVSLAQSLAMSGFGIAAFCLGYIVQGLGAGKRGK